jgi:ABC-type branched-subunit amino acid transport system ATPase component
MSGGGATPALEAAGLTKHYGGIKVFDDVSFALSQGEILGVIGPNGAGKTTLINVLCCEVPRTSGKILLGGKDISDSRLNLVSQAGLVRTFQQTNTYRSKTVRENLDYALRFGNREDKTHLDAVAEMLDRFDLTRRLNEVSDKIPYGSQKLLGLMLAFMTRPSVLLMDEPAAGLELREREYIDFFVSKLRDVLHCSVLIVEHDIELIRRLCSRIIVLDGGRVLAQGEPNEVLSRKDVLAAYVGEVEEA